MERPNPTQLLEQLENSVDAETGQRRIQRAYGKALNAPTPAVRAEAMRTLAEELRAAAAIAQELASIAEQS